MNLNAVPWLGALLSTDGHVRVTGKSRAYTIRSTEREWLRQIQLKLYFTLGIETSIYGNPKRGYDLYLKNPKLVTKLLKKHGIDWIIERKARDIETGYTALEIPRNVLLKLKTDPVYFLEKLFGIKLYPYQGNIVREVATGNPLVLIEKGRQIGISYAMGGLGIWYCATKPKKRVLGLSLYKEQAKVILRYGQMILFQKPALLEDLVETPYGLTRTSIKFRDGSLFDISNCRRPNADNVRSKFADLLIIDEAILLFDKMFNAIEPLTVAKNGQKVYISTAGAEGCFFHSKVSKVKMRAKKSELILPEKSQTAKVISDGGTVFYLPSCQYHSEEKSLKKRFTDILCPVFTHERLQEALEDLKSINFQREYCVKWLGTENQMFPIVKKWGPTEGAYVTPRRLYAGLDVGESRHPTVLTILQGDSERCKTVKTKGWRRAPDRKTLAKYVWRALKPWKVQELRMDKTGIGMGLYERIVDLGLPVLGVSWNKQVKNRLMFNLKDALGSEILRVGENEDQLLYELRGYFGEPIEGTNWFEFKCIDSDDYVDSLALGWDAVPKWKIVPKTSITARDRRAIQ